MFVLLFLQGTSAGSLPGPASYETAASLADGAMCGVSAIGLGLLESVMLLELQQHTMAQYQADGMVPAQYCVRGTEPSAFGSTAAYVSLGCRALVIATHLHTCWTGVVAAWAGDLRASRCVCAPRTHAVRSPRARHVRTGPRTTR